MSSFLAVYALCAFFRAGVSPAVLAAVLAMTLSRPSRGAGSATLGSFALRLASLVLVYDPQAPYSYPDATQFPGCTTGDTIANCTNGQWTQ
ncbi:MAG: hypothetical protein ABI282_00875 [Candidatus Baltobacteraceae bacterium]